MCRPVESESPVRTTHKKIARLPTFVVGRSSADPKTDMGNEIVVVPTLTKAKSNHKQVLSQDNPSPSTFAQKHNKVAPRVGRYLIRGNPPPSDTLLDGRMKGKPKTDLQSIHGDTYPRHVRTVGTFPGLQNVQPVLSQDVVPLPNGSERPLAHRRVKVMTRLHDLQIP
ncbi:hypothetical protein B296_00019667 [Ensete ventricosum]|uniref:Uncharacterized protein n=1 Tax=Ensete ventricosum TaxID=4639 RepID=A0A426ZDA2_ENSVE|nr:hypothetical protein B296_00019667 [Ensete ventricosum]